MSLHRLENGFLSTHVVGKWGQYRGVKCMKCDGAYYVLEGDRADGYRLLAVSDEVLQDAGKEPTEAGIKYMIEEYAAATFYYWDGEGYVRYDSDKFPTIRDDDIYDNLMRQMPDSVDFINHHRGRDCTRDIAEMTRILKEEKCLTESQMAGISDTLWSMAARCISPDSEVLIEWFHSSIPAFHYRIPIKIRETDGENLLFSYMLTMPC